MKNLRHQNKGQAPLLSPGLQEAFHQALRKPHPRDGLWTPPSGLASGWDVRRACSWMRRLGFAPLGPRPRHRQADPEAQEAFKKRFLMVFWLKLLFRWRSGLLLRTGWGSSPSAGGYGPRRPRSGPATTGCGCTPS